MCMGKGCELQCSLCKNAQRQGLNYSTTQLPYDAFSFLFPPWMALLRGSSGMEGNGSVVSILESVVNAQVVGTIYEKETC